MNISGFQRVPIVVLVVRNLSELEPKVKGEQMSWMTIQMHPRRMRYC